LERIGPDRGIRPARAGFLRTARAAEATRGEGNRQGVCQQLRAPQLPAAWALVETNAPVRGTTPLRAIGRRLEEGRSLPEFRRRQARVYPVAGMVALIGLATFCDMMRGQRDLAAFPRKLAQPQLRALGCYCDPHTGRVRCPGETAFSAG